MLKISIRKYLSIIFTLAVFTVFLFYFFSNSSDFEILLELNIYLVLLTFLLYLLSSFINGVFTKILLQPFNKTISLLESIYVSIISSIGNFFAPAGAGFGFRAIYLKKRFGLRYSEFISTLAGNYVIVILVSSFFGLLSLYFLRENAGSQYYFLLLIFAIIFLSSLAISFIKIPYGSKSYRNKYVRSFLSAVYRVTQGWNMIISHKQLMLQLAGLAIFNLLLLLGINWSIIHSLQLEITLPALILFSVLGSFSLFINITPANIGIKEAIYIFSSSVLGFSTSEIIAIALIDRTILFITLVALWLFSGKMKPQVQHIREN